MSKGNDPESAAGMAVIAAIGLIAIFLFFVAYIFSLVITIICIWAWNREREVFGQRFTPIAARGFIAWGIVGAILFSLFGQFLYAKDWLMEENLSWMPHVGYVIGSFSWAGYYGQNEDDLEARAYERESQQYGGTIVQQAKAARLAEAAATPPPAVEAKPQFQFADWDDEELRG